MASKINPYATGLDKVAANYVPLTPLSFLERSADIYPDHPAVIHGQRRYTWSQTRERAHRLASALIGLGVGSGDTVAVMLNNTPEMYECHFGVPMTGAVLNTLNTRLDAQALTFMLNHNEAQVLVTDREYSPTVEKVLSQLGRKITVIDVNDAEYTGPGNCLGQFEYESFIAGGDPAYCWHGPDDEWDAISLNYTSGTTGSPKGVVYHHRGAYLNAVSNILSWGMPQHAVYLWTLPMFHCNGWCFPWTMAANAGTNICLRKVDAKLIFDAIRAHQVSHYCGAPIVHSLLINAPPEMREGIMHSVSCLIAGAPPPAAIIEGMERIGFNITHVYGLTRRTQRTAGSALPHAGRHHGDVSANHATGSAGWADHG